MEAVAAAEAAVAAISSLAAATRNGAGATAVVGVLVASSAAKVVCLVT